MGLMRKGMVAVSGHGHRGLITEDAPREVLLEDGRTVMAWVGLNLSPHRIGSPWQSTDPKPLYQVSDRTFNTMRCLAERARTQH